MQQAPIVNINGTAVDELLSQIINCFADLKRAQHTMTRACPHGRDFQTAPDNSAFNLATKQHRSRMVRLEEIIKEYEELGVAIAEQRDDLIAAKRKSNAHVA